jgi:quercetin dioxygenase-like cupin family protein
LVFYIISFKPFEGSNKTVSPLKISPLFVDWKNVEFKPSENGGRRNIMQQKTSVLKELEIHVTTLKEGFPSHAAHTHPDEEIILIRKGYVEETIKGEPFRLGPGSIIFLTNDDFHGISNSGKGECEYYAIRWLTYQGAL